ncbi:plasmid mobilization protein [Mucilaginibacter defluvii]|uniref:Mobilization protein MobC n=1 Tax=Mucilaginibacter defluvii TaxID=1196019 RepID=A0ABP9G112_9SPHI
MARPTVHKDEKRIFRITIRLTAIERLQVQQAAKAAGLSNYLYVREKLLKGRAPEPKLARIDIDTYVELKKIGTNINQLARQTNSGRFPFGISSALRDLSEQLQLIIKILLN